MGSKVLRRTHDNKAHVVTDAHRDHVPLYVFSDLDSGIEFACHKIDWRIRGGYIQNDVRIRWPNEHLLSAT